LLIDDRASRFHSTTVLYRTQVSSCKALGSSAISYTLKARMEVTAAARARRGFGHLGIRPDRGEVDMNDSRENSLILCTRAAISNKQMIPADAKPFNRPL
jgi:hypothetical protein